MRGLRIAVLVLLGLLAIAAAWVAWTNLAPHPVPPASASPSVQRGAYLARAGNCMACHTDRGGAAYAGGRAIDTPFGTVYASNLTPSRTGLMSWSADDFWGAMHHGRSRSGRLLYPAFPYPNYTEVTRADADDLYAFLRSVPPVEQPNKPHDLRWPYSTQVALAAWRTLFFRPAPYQSDTTKSAEWNRGAYLVRGLGHCAACHTARNALGASSDMMDLSGGLIPMQNWYAPSLASAAEAGVAGWPTEEVVRLLGTGATARATVLGPMAEVVQHSTQHLNRDDLTAMAVFLQALPQTQPEPKAPAAPPPAQVAERGAKLYGQHCAQCHGEQGQGIAGAYPPLAGNRAVTMGNTANLVQVVLGGGYAPATAGNPRPFGMPPYATVLNDADVAAVLSHIRAGWGNQAEPVSELAVSRQRGTSRP